MKKVEDLLLKRKLEIDQLEIPEKLEMKLRSSLDNLHLNKGIKNKWRINALVLFIVVILIGYNINTLAFYTKRIVGYDSLMDDSLKRLNDNGKGQIIDKSHTFKNGVIISLDGVMVDDNQLLVFYTMKDPKGNIDRSDLHLDLELKGIGGIMHTDSGQGETNDEKTEIKWSVSFEPPNLLQKNLNFILKLSDGNIKDEGNINFTLDRNKAMGKILKKNINKSIKLEGRNIRFKSILASPTNTIIKGTFKDSSELIKDKVRGKGVDLENIELKLIANGKEIHQVVGGIKSNIGGISLHASYEALPTNLEKLEIQLVSVDLNNNVNEQVRLNTNNTENISLKVLGKDIEINKVYEDKGKTYVVITTEKDVILSKVHLIIDGKVIPLEETISKDNSKDEEGISTHTRTLRFNKTGENLELRIEKLKYNKMCNEVIDIPLN